MYIVLKKLQNLKTNTVILFNILIYELHTSWFCDTHCAGSPSKCFALLQQDLSGVLMVIHYNHIVGTHHKGVEAAILLLQVTEQDVWRQLISKVK